MKKLLFTVFTICILSMCVFSQDASATRIPANSRVYVAPMEGFETYVVAAIQKKKAPLIIVNNRETADFEITGTMEKIKAGWAKTIFVTPNPEINASVQIINLRTGITAYSISSNKNNAWRGRKGSAEHLAKNLVKKMKEDGEMK